MKSHIGAVTGFTGTAGFTEADFRFAPDAERAARVDGMVRRRLADSLTRIFHSADGVLEWRPPALERLLTQIRRGPVRAAVMALYSDLVEAAFADEVRAAQRLTDELLSLPAAVPAGRIYTLDDASLGAGQAERFLRIISDGNAAKLAFHPLSSAARIKIAPIMQAALALLRQGAPELAAEIDILVREIVLAETRQPASDATEIGGSSIFYLWGASFIGFNHLPDRLELAEALAHEAAHVLLFGLSLGKPLVGNGNEARYASPLRDDPRPMEGLVHAAYVLARLTWTMQQFQKSGGLSKEEAARAARWEMRNRHDFAACLDIIQSEADFTPAGAAAFEDAARFMREKRFSPGNSASWRSAAASSAID